MHQSTKDFGHLATWGRAEQGHRVLILAYLCLTWMEQKWSLMCWSPCALLVCFPGFFGQWLHLLNSSRHPSPHWNNESVKEMKDQTCNLKYITEPTEAPASFQDLASSPQKLLSQLSPRKTLHILGSIPYSRWTARRALSYLHLELSLPALSHQVPGTVRVTSFAPPVKITYISFAKAARECSAFSWQQENTKHPQKSRARLT
jgi:hypothetical protein